MEGQSEIRVQILEPHSEHQLREEHVACLGQGGLVLAEIGRMESVLME